MVRDLAVTFKTRKPLSAAFEFDRDNVQITVIVYTACLAVDINAIHNFVMDHEFHFISLGK